MTTYPSFVVSFKKPSQWILSVGSSTMMKNRPLIGVLAFDIERLKFLHDTGSDLNINSYIFVHHLKSYFIKEL